MSPGLVAEPISEASTKHEGSRFDDARISLEIPYLLFRYSALSKVYYQQKCMERVEALGIGRQVVHRLITRFFLLLLPISRVSSRDKFPAWNFLFALRRLFRLTPCSIISSPRIYSVLVVSPSRNLLPPHQFFGMWSDIARSVIGPSDERVQPLPRVQLWAPDRQDPVGRSKPKARVAHLMRAQRLGFVGAPPDGANLEHPIAGSPGLWSLRHRALVKPGVVWKEGGRVV